MVKISFQKDLCLGCKSCELACAAAHSVTKTIRGAISEGSDTRIHIKLNNGKLRAQQCKLCKNPRCISSCPTNALSRDESGIIKVNKFLCTSCGNCKDACPFGAISFDVYPSICDRCKELEVPMCAQSCPTQALKVKIV